MNKERLKLACLQELDHRIAELKTILEGVLSAIHGETKSTAGDKHETSRAQAQLEAERLGNQLKIMEESRERLVRVSIDKTTLIRIGSYVETSIGAFYISESLGKVDFEGKSCFVISAQAPLAQAFLGKQTGDEFYVNPNISGKITAVF